jgi:hypothetical protein
MPDPDPLIEFIRPEFPKTELTESAVVTRIEYIGPKDSIVDYLPLPGEAWGDYPGQVKSSSYEPTEDIDTTVAMVSVEQPIDNSETDTGELVATSYEIRWLTIERSMAEHPAFSAGGEFELSGGDIYDIEKWKAPENTKELRDAYSYNENGYDTQLSANAKMFARGFELGLETYEDKAPTAIKISEYVGGPPPETDAGLKEDPPGDFPNLPTGFEWRKETADSTRAGGATKWNLTEEWLGAKRVIFDRLNVYWDPPQ